MVECRTTMALEAARGVGLGKHGRARSPCRLCIEAKTEGEAIGKRRQSGLATWRDYAREEIEPPTTQACAT